MIYTFYSFKGGVGRSMAVANLAECFHAKGLRVVVIDWDLEAPGIEAYFFAQSGSRTTVTDSRARLGLIDMILRYKDGFSKHTVQVSDIAIAESSRGLNQDDSEILKNAELVSDLLVQKGFPKFLTDAPKIPLSTPGPLTVTELLKEVYQDSQPTGHDPDFPDELSQSPLRTYLQCVHRPESERNNGLYLISAGSRPEKEFSRYASQVQNFDWSEFYAAYEGRRYFEWLRSCLAGIADVVLIDSRTGVTEMGGVCTRQMADAVVSFCAPNFQNVDGVVKIVSGLNSEKVRKARDDREVDVLVIPTRIDDFESDLLAKFSSRFRETVESAAVLPPAFRGLERPLWNLQIPYIPRYNYQEKLVVGPWADAPDPATQKIVDAYQKIAAHLAVLAPDSQIRSAYAAELVRYFPDSLEPRVPQQAPSPPENWVSRPAEFGKLKEALLKGASTPSVSKVAICGVGGIGKTALAAAVCNDPGVISAFPDGIVWISFDKFWSKGDLFEFLHSTFGVRGTGDTSLLRELAKKRFLLVMDDVWDMHDVEEIARFGSQCTQLIITRNSGVAASFSANDLIALGPLTEEQSLSLLKGLPPLLMGLDEEHAQLGQALQRLPLGASLMRMAYERAIAQQQTPEQASWTVRQAFMRHGIAAFDTLRTADRSLSLSRSLQQTLSRLSPAERKLLLIFLRGQKGLLLSGVETRVLRILSKLIKGQTPDPKSEEDNKDKAQLSVLIKPETRTAGAEGGSAAPPVEELGRLSLKRLSELGLIRLESETAHVQVHELVAEYLISQGELGPTNRDQSKATQGSDDHQQGVKTAGVSSSDDRRGNKDVQRATAVLRGESTTLDEIQSLAERLKDSRYFSLARKLFRSARQHPDAARLSPPKKLKLIQRHALCTYRDPELSAQRFEAALNILQEGDLNDATPSQETLGLAGAIYKNRWRLSGQRDDLERSFFYYNAGWQQPLQGDFGYTGINAAFVLDLLASTEQHDSPETAEARRNEAHLIREQIASDLPLIGDKKENAWLKLEWWYFATLAEACFGAARYEEARFWLREGLPLDPPGWQLESTARQLALLAYTQNPALQEESEAWTTLKVIAGDGVSALRSIEIGKVGLALSGGGFRASLFHIGVLARLAELDALRHIEVLSCVSGGSIVGAHYYLEVRRLLESKADWEIIREDYVEIVARIERDFLAAVQKNLRTRLFANPAPNLLSLIVPGYTRTKRLGNLYEKHIYSRAENGGSGPFYLEELRINPKDWEGNFNPKIDNWRRSAKVPILLLNATSLNTGHNWQFSVSWMGEPPAANANSVDRNEILRRMYYWEAPAKYRKRKLRLGHAVAASSCVPALFDPIELPGLYPERTVRLVDGGVHDNQGIAGLLEQECSVVLVSDGSGQMNSEEHPSSEISAVPIRSNSILMARVREAEALQLDALRRSSALNGLMFLHLKQDLEAQNVDWIECDDPYEPLLGSAPKNTLTGYGIPRAVQQYLAGLRTDLDSFTDREAYALMFSGYRMADKNFRECIPHFPSGGETRREWNFLQVESLLKSKEGRELEYARFIKMLKVGASRGFKIWKLWPLMGVIGVLAVIAGGYSIYELWNKHPLRIWPAFAVIGAVLAAIWLFNLLVRSRKSLSVILTGALFGTVGWAVARLHLLVFDPLFLLNGSMLKTGSSRVIRSFLPLFMTMVFIAGGTLGFKYFGGSLIQPKDEIAQLRRSAESEQRAQHYSQAAMLWTRLLARNQLDKNIPAARAYTAQIYSDRAYCYKLSGEWEKSIPDLTAALAASPPNADKIRLLNDRAGAYVEVRQPEAALADYNMVLQLDPRNRIATSNQSWLGNIFAPTQPGTPPVFVFVKFTHEPVTSLTDVLNDLPAAVKKLYPRTVRGLNIRGWANPIPQNEVRYSDRRSEKLAFSIVKELERGNFVATGPVSTRSTAPPRVELWLATTSKSRTSK